VKPPDAKAGAANLNEYYLNRGKRDSAGKKKKLGKEKKEKKTTG